ncbi:MAG: tetratricopeptide repeat protein [Alphaproteobacteria bacterium]
MIGANKDEIVVALFIASLLGVAALIKFIVLTPLGKKSDGPNAEDKLIERNEALAKKLGATEAQLQSHLDTMQAHDIPPDQLEARLQDMLEREREMLERLGATPAVNEETDALREEAEEAIRAGEPERAASLLHQAETRDTQAAVGLDDEADNRRRAASESALAQGTLAWINLDYTTAARHFHRAASLLPEGDTVARAEALNRAGRTYFDLADYAKAEAVLMETVYLFEDSLTPDDSRLAPAINNLAALYKTTNRLAEAEPLMDRALKIDEHAHGPDHPVVAIRLSNLAGLYCETDRLAAAEQLYDRALKINEQAHGPDHPNVAICLSNLAELYRVTDRLAEAEPLYERALKIDEHAYGPDHPEVATDLNNLALLYQATDRLIKAEPLMDRALKIGEQAYGSDHPKVAIRLNNLAGLYRVTARLNEAEKFFERALGIFEKSLGPDHPTTVLFKTNLAVLRAEMGEDDK